MNFFIKKDILKRSLSSVEGAIAKNANLPSLSNISISAKNNLVQFQATNLELGVVVSAPATIESDGDVLITPRILNAFLSGATDSDITFKNEGENSLLLKEEKRSATVQIEDTGEFPIIPRVSDLSVAIIPAVKLIPALVSVVNSASLSEAKPELAGVYIDISEKEVVVAATDSFRLSEARVVQQGTSPHPIQCIVPLRFANLLIKVFSESGDDIRVALEENQVAVWGENNGCEIYIVSKIIEGEYPAYTSIIPTEFTTTVVLPKSSLTQHVRGAGAFSSRAQTVRIEIDGNNLYITSEEGEVGSFQASLECQTEGEATSLVFNYHYLLDGLQNIQEDQVSLKVSRKDGPILLQGVQQKQYLYLLMPIRDT